MTNPRVKCDYCGYLGDYMIDVYKDNENKFCCSECGTDELKMMLKKKIENAKNNNN